MNKKDLNHFKKQVEKELLEGLQEIVLIRNKQFTLKGAIVTLKEYLDSESELDCPHCSEPLFLSFEEIEWFKTHDLKAVRCPNCGRNFLVKII